MARTKTNEFELEIDGGVQEVEIPYEYQSLYSAFVVFATLAGKHKIDTPEKMNKVLGIKTGHKLYAGDLLAHSMHDYIRFTSKIIFWRHKRGK